MVGPAEQAEALARRVAAVRDPALRVAYVRDLIRGMSPPDLAVLFTVVLGRAEAKDARFVSLHLALSLALSGPETARLRRSVARTAAAAGLEEIATSLGSPDPETSDPEAAGPRNRPDSTGEPRVPDLGMGRPLTLGERKTLARTRDRDLIARIIRDPHPAVVRILLDNPSLTEQDVIRVVAARPGRSDVLRSVFANPRWVARYRVRSALVLNPDTPLDVTLLLCPLLTVSDARRVAGSAEYDIRLRRACQRSRRTSSQLH